MLNIREEPSIFENNKSTSAIVEWCQEYENDKSTSTIFSGIKSTSAILRGANIEPFEMKCHFERC